MKIALASPPYPASVSAGLAYAEKMIIEAAEENAVLICFPETYIPGYPVTEHAIKKPTESQLKDALESMCTLARRYAINVIIPMDWYDEGKFLNVAFVISDKGEILGYQTKNQLDPSEDNRWIPGTKRSVFEVKDVKFGIVICHEGFRYPETVRWAARNGTQIVFHPHYSGSDVDGVQLTEWGHKDSPYYEKAMMMRAVENTIYFASVGYATRFQESATSIIAPDGSYLTHQPYGKAGVLLAEIEPDKATGLLAHRFKPQLY